MQVGGGAVTEAVERVGVGEAGDGEGLQEPVCVWEAPEGTRVSEGVDVSVAVAVLKEKVCEEETVGRSVGVGVSEGEGVPVRVRGEAVGVYVDVGDVVCDMDPETGESVPVVTDTLRVSEGLRVCGGVAVSVADREAEGVTEHVADAVGADRLQERLSDLDPLPEAVMDVLRENDPVKEADTVPDAVAVRLSPSVRVAVWLAVRDSVDV